METCTYGLGEGNRKPAAAMSKGADCLSHLESVYEKACEVEFVSRGLDVRRQVSYSVVYKGRKVGTYVADMVVENTIILELKSVKCLAEDMEAQLLNYLRISGLPVGYLVNFRNSRVGWRRFVR